MYAMTGWRRVILATAGALFATGSAAATPPPSTVGEILAGARHAIGQDGRPMGVVELRGTANRYGLDVSYTLQIGPGGRFVERTEGPLGERYGFDGRAAWTVDETGFAMPLEMEDAETEETGLWVETGRWADLNGPFDIAIDRDTGAPGTVALSLRLRQGLLHSRLVLNASTWLPVELTYTASSGQETWKFADYRADAGRVLAHSWSHEATGNVDRFQIDSGGPAARGATFRIPSVRPDDTRFDLRAPALVPTIRSPSGHTFVHPLINGKDVGWFFLDTGAGGMCVTPEAADAAGMPAFGKAGENGVGGNVQARYRRLDRFELGPVSISHLPFVELDLKFLAPAFKFKIGGIVGYDLFCRAVVRLEVSTGRVWVYDPARYKAPAAEWERLHLESRNAALRCNFDGDHSAIFKLDTGAGNDTVTFHAPAVVRYGLLHGRDTTGSNSGGVGGTVEARNGTIAWFEIGGHRFEEPKVSFSLAKQGAFTDVYVAGNVGQGFLMPFTVVFDYPHRRIGFVATGGPQVSTTPRT